MSWLFLVLAGVLEICWSIGLKYTQGFTVLVPSLLTGSAIVLSIFFLAKASQDIPIGTAYAIWVGIGAVGAALGGIFLFKEAVTPFRIFFIALLVVSVIGLKFSSGK